MIHEGWKCSLEGDHSYSLLKPLVIHSVYVQYTAMVVMIRHLNLQSTVSKKLNFIPFKPGQGAKVLIGIFRN